jgi:hypothetical protein
LLPPNFATANAFLWYFGLHETGSALANPLIALGAFGGGSNNGTVWSIRSRDAGTTTSVVTAIGYSAATWYNLRLVVAADGSSFEAFVDGVSVGTKATNLPPAGTMLRPWAQIWTASGATAMVATNLDIDYIRAVQYLTTPRN